MALNVQQNYLEKGVDNKEFPNGEEVESNAKKTAKNLEENPEAKGGFVSKIKEILGFPEKAETGDVEKKPEDVVGPEGSPEEKKLSNATPKGSE